VRKENAATFYFLCANNEKYETAEALTKALLAAKAALRKPVSIGSFWDPTDTNSSVSKARFDAEFGVLNPLSPLDSHKLYSCKLDFRDFVSTASGSSLIASNRL